MFFFEDGEQCDLTVISRLPLRDFGTEICGGLFVTSKIIF